MNYQSQNDFYDPDDVISIFSFVTDIKLYKVSFSDKTAHHDFCNQCITTIRKILSQHSKPYGCNFYLFPCGSFHIFTKSILSDSFFYISEPILCEFSTAKCCKNVQKRPKTQFSVMKIYHMAKLLYLVTNMPIEKFYNELPYRKLKNQLTEAVACNDLASVKSVLHNAFEEIYETKDIEFKNIKCKQNDIIQKSVQIIEKDYMNKITQNSVAKAVSLSPAYFSKLFHGITGQSFSRYLNHIRIANAKKLLENPSNSIDSVYQAVGFESRSYFGKIFKKTTGVTPKKYKDLHKKILKN